MLVCKKPRRQTQREASRTQCEASQNQREALKTQRKAEQSWWDIVRVGRACLGHVDFVNTIAGEIWA